MPHDYGDLEAALEREEIDFEDYVAFFENKQKMMTDFYEGGETLNPDVLDDLKPDRYEPEEIEPMGLFKYLEQL